MALHGSFNAGAPKAVRLSKMSSIPTTEDLKYALAESKRHGKLVELPFENYKVLFLIKVLHQGNSAPRWTFQRGEGHNAKVVWTRESSEVLMIQNKIKTESAYEQHQVEDQASSGYQNAYQGAPSYAYEEEPYAQEEQAAGNDQSGQDYQQHSVPPASMGFGSQPAGGGIPQKGFGNLSTSQSMPAWAPNTPGQPDQQSLSTSQNMPAWSPQGQGPSASQQGMSSIPQKGFSEQSLSGRQVAFQPSQEAPASGSKILMPQRFGGFGAAPETNEAPPNPPPDQPDTSSQMVDPVYQGSDKMGDDNKVQFDMSGLFGSATDTSATAPSTGPSTAQQMRLPPEPPPPPTPLPPAVNFDPNLIKGAHTRLLDPRTGLMAFDSLVFFLQREFSRFQKHKSGLTFVICEVVIIHNGQVVSLPAEFLPVVAQRISAVCKPLDMAAYMNGNEFAILVDGGDKQSAAKFGQMLYQSLAGTPLTPQLPPNSTVVAIGLATIPGTCEDAGVLVAAAQQAKEMAKDSTPSILLFPN